MKVALVHDWLTGMRGGENCLEVFCELFPEADIYTLLHIRGSVSDTIESHRIITSFIKNLPFARKKYRYYLPLMPYAISRFDLHNYDLIFSSSHCVAKGVIVQKTTMHVCYCHTPMRYVWEFSDEYFGHCQTNVVTKAPLSALVKYLQNWDVHSSQNVDYFLANSYTVKDRIQKYYNRDADVIYPPVDTEKFNIAEKRDNYYLVVSALVPYKRIDIAVRAFNALGFPLKVIGAGHEGKTLKKMAQPNIEFLCWQDKEVLGQDYSRCKALIFPGIEDFGIVPLEAMASGRPVIAYAKGGALETVVSIDQTHEARSATGIFFHEQTPQSLIDAVYNFQKIQDKFDPLMIRRHAQNFRRPIFKEKIKNFIENKLGYLLR